MSESEQDHERAREFMRTWHEKLPRGYSEGGVVPDHAPFELQGGDLHGFRFCQACRKTWPCGEQARKGDPEADIQHGGAL